MSLGSIRGALAGAALAAAIVGVVDGALYLRQVNAGERELRERPARLLAHTLAVDVGRAIGNPPAVQQLVAGLLAKDATVRLTAVVAEPKSVKYRFLRKRRYLAHSDPARAGRALDPSSLADKATYDLAGRLRQSQRSELRTVSRPGAPPHVQAAVPVIVAGRPLATAIVVTEPPARGPLVRAWPIAAALGLCLLMGLAGGALRPRRPYPIVLLGVLACGGASLAFLAHVRRAYDAALGASAASPLPSAGIPALVCAIVLGLAVCVLGHVGVGARLLAGLRRHRYAAAYIAPAAIGMLLLVFIPFGYGLGLGFFDHAHGTYTWVGLGNFVEILSGGGRPITHPLNFYYTLGVTVLWTVLNVALHVSIGLVLALVLSRPLLGFKGVYRVLLILPWAVPNYITALIWKGMFHHQYGAVNHLLGLLGVEKVSWFSSFSTSFIANVTTNTWLGFPFMMVVCLGALQSIPRDVYEAAAVDGASRWQSFWRITMPLLRPALFPAIVLGSIWTFNMFNIIYLVSGGEPAGATDILITEAYRWAFERADRYGLAAAYATIIFLILLAYTLITNRMTRATEDVLE